MITFHPHARAFWEPIRAALAAGLLGGAFGLGIGWVDGAANPWPAALVWAAGLGIVAWAWERAMWQRIIVMTYQPIKTDQIEDAVSAETDAEIYMTTCEGGTTIHLIRGLPIEPALLHEYAQGLVQGKRTTYSEWIGLGKPFTQESYLSLCLWMKANRLADGEPGRALTITDKGKDLLRDVFERGIKAFSPTEMVSTSEI